MSAIRVVEETEVAPGADGSWVKQSTQPQAAAMPEPDGRLESAIAAIRTLDGILGKANARLAALEAAMQGLPAGVGLLRSLVRALGSRAIALIGLLGCLGLAVETILYPSWQGLATLGIMVAGVILLVVLPPRGSP